MSLGDGQSALRYVVHNEVVARFLHQNLTPVVAAVAGVPVKPSYVYTANYLPGAVLPRHIDRAQCKYSISLCVDYLPEPVDATPWPLWLETATGTVAVYQELGDALFYRGCELPHFRTQLPPGHRSTSLFLHYVDAAFTGPLD